MTENLGPIELNGKTYAPTEEVGGIIIAREIPHAPSENSPITKPIIDQKPMRPRRFPPATFNCALPSIEGQNGEATETDPPKFTPRRRRRNSSALS